MERGITLVRFLYATLLTEDEHRDAIHGTGREQSGRLSFTPWQYRYTLVTQILRSVTATRSDCHTGSLVSAVLSY